MRRKRSTVTELYSLSALQSNGGRSARLKTQERSEMSPPSFAACKGSKGALGVPAKEASFTSIRSGTGLFAGMWRAAATSLIASMKHAFRIVVAKILSILIGVTAVAS